MLHPLHPPHPGAFPMSFSFPADRSIPAGGGVAVLPRPCACSPLALTFLPPVPVLSDSGRWSAAKGCETQICGVMPWAHLLLVSHMLPSSQAFPYPNPFGLLCKPSKTALCSPSRRAALQSQLLPAQHPGASLPMGRMVPQGRFRGDCLPHHPHHPEGWWQRAGPGTGAEHPAGLPGQSLR